MQCQCKEVANLIARVIIKLLSSAFSILHPEHFARLYLTITGWYLTQVPHPTLSLRL